MLAYSTPQIQHAYDHCLKIVRGHYENFPVASFLLPKNLRQPIAVIYAFARTADDFADEGDLNEQQRLQQLNHYETLLDSINRTPNDDLIFIALEDVIKQHQLPIQLFKDLLSAFKQDVTKHRYDNFEQVLDYCARSANPVGRLLLHLLKEDSDENLRYSDQICSSLQLINFLQDIYQDYQENDRIYLPLDEMQQYGVTDTTISQQLSNNEMRALITHQLQRARQMMLDGSVLGVRIKGRFGLQLRTMINGGLQICKLLENNRENVYARPRLATVDWISIARHSILRRFIQ